MKITDKQIAGILFLFLACFPVGSWVILLFVGNPPNASPLAQLSYTFSSENEHLIFFIWLAVSAVVSVGIALFWFMSRSVSFSLVVGVTIFTIAQALGYLVWSQWEEVALSLLPLYWVHRAYKNRPNPLFQPTP